MNRLAIPPGGTLGVIGGGQLGRMFVHAAQRMGYRTIVLSPEGDGPAAQASNESIVAAYDDLAALHKLAAEADAVTIEFENVSAAALRLLGRSIPVRPSWRTVWICQNRLREKTFLADRGFPSPPWAPLRNEADLAQIIKHMPIPLILKTAASGYDGKGQIKVERRAEIERSWRALGGVKCVAEGFVDFIAELSVIIARGVDGQSTVFPTALNRHARHILDTTVLPAPVGPIVTLESKRLAIEVAEALDLIGVLTVELFLGQDGTLLINELAPRPHNSGHATIEACVTSQFEQQVRVMSGSPPGSTDLLFPTAMANLLGEIWAEGEPDWRVLFEFDPGVKLHLYGKSAAAAGRKMGHLTVVDREPQTALNRAIAAREAVQASYRRIS